VKNLLTTNLERVSSDTSGLSRDVSLDSRLVKIYVSQDKI